HPSTETRRRMSAPCFRAAPTMRLVWSSYLPEDLMNLPSRPRVAIFAFVMGLLIASAWGYRQVVGIQPVTPTVLSGAHFGFRLDGKRAGTPVGPLVVKMNGQWVEADIAAPGLPKRISAK